MKKNYESLYEFLGGTYREENGHLIPNVALFKATNPLLWVQEMNNCKAYAEEVVLREVIYQ